MIRRYLVSETHASAMGAFYAGASAAAAIMGGFLGGAGLPVTLPLVSSYWIAGLLGGLVGWAVAWFLHRSGHPA